MAGEVYMRWLPWIAGVGLYVLAIVAALLYNVLGGTSCVFPVENLFKKIDEVTTMYAAKHKGQYPDSLEEAKRYFPEERVPTDNWGNPILYLRVPEGTPYVLVSLGADGRIGGVNQDADVTSLP